MPSSPAPEPPDDSRPSLIRELSDALASRIAQRPASRVAMAFLDAMQRRSLAEAARHIGADFAMCFPGGLRMRRLEELVSRSGGRYRFVAKRVETIDEAPLDGGAIAVYCAGTLYGEWTDGAPFEGIRFIDRLEIVDGRIRQQDVWNDIGEVRARL